MKYLMGCLTLVAAVSLSGCKPTAAPVAENKVEKVSADESASTATKMKGVGKKSPDAVFDAIVDATKEDKENELLELIANDAETHEGWEGMVKVFSGDGGREEGVKQVFSAFRRGFGVDEPHKRFPAETEGDNAYIILLMADPFAKEKNQYTKYEFVKSGELWYYTKKTFGPIEDIDQEKYKWDRNE